MPRKVDRRTFVTATGAAGVAGLAGCIGDTDDEDDFPTDDITVVHPYGTGSAIAATTLLIQERNQEHDVFPVDIRTEEREGGGGIVGYNYVHNAAADGYTLSEAITPALLLKPFEEPDSVEYEPPELTYICGGPRAVIVGAVAADSDIETGQDYIDALIDGAEFSAVGATSSLTVRLISIGAVSDLYDAELALDRLISFGIADTAPAVIRGDVELTGLDFSVVVDFVEDDELKIPLFLDREENLTDRMREVAPDADTLEDLDLTDDQVDEILEMYPMEINNSWVAPPDTPDDVKDTLEDGFEELINNDEYAQEIEDRALGIPHYLSGEEVQSQVADAYSAWQERDEITQIWQQ